MNNHGFLAIKNAQKFEKRIGIPKYDIISAISPRQFKAMAGAVRSIEEAEEMLQTAYHYPKTFRKLRKKIDAFHREEIRSAATVEELINLHAVIKNSSLDTAREARKRILEMSPSLTDLKCIYYATDGGSEERGIVADKISEVFEVDLEKHFQNVVRFCLDHLIGLNATTKVKMWKLILQTSQSFDEFWNVYENHEHESSIHQVVIPTIHLAKRYEDFKRIHEVAKCAKNMWQIEIQMLEKMFGAATTQLQLIEIWTTSNHAILTPVRIKKLRRNIVATWDRMAKQAKTFDEVREFYWQSLIPLLLTKNGAIQRMFQAAKSKEEFLWLYQVNFNNPKWRLKIIKRLLRLTKKKR